MSLAVVPDADEVVSALEQRLQRTLAVHPQINPATRRPYGITPEQRVVVIEAVRAGNFFKTACQFAGVSYEVFADWMVKGGDPESTAQNKPDNPVEPYKSFAAEVRQAEADSEKNLLDAIQAAGSHDWRAPAWILARKHPERWAEQKGNLQVATTGDVRIVLPDNKRDSGDLGQLGNE